ncbi:glutathione S-transferase family protein [Palleronia sp. KMU-117]|uniref:glutathione S-transferase family protein n=1 Tax=Palleronia sp. KMU-117 TaxID=3434108 RepID=UPI003D74F24D
MLTLYHYDRSTAAQRVRLLLDEKGLPWKSVIVDTARGDIDQLPENYHEINPKGLVPTIENKGVGIAESLIILEYLEDAFPETSFRPTSAEDRAKMRLWMRRIDDGIHVASRTIGVCIVNRFIYLEQGAEKIRTYHEKMRDHVRRDNDRVNIEMGLASPLLPDALKRFRALFEDMNTRLEGHDWLAGEAYSLADIALVVYLRRMESFMMAPLWSHLTALNTWYARIAERPAYKTAVIDWGDITEAKRTEHGQGAFPEIAKLWMA